MHMNRFELAGQIKVFFKFRFSGFIQEMSQLNEALNLQIIYLMAKVGIMSK